MERSYEVGKHVVYVDPQGVAHDAVVTVWWSLDYYRKEGKEPGCNLVYVSGDPAKDDTYGRQIERSTSVIHMGVQPAHGNYWRWPDESK